MEDENKCLIFSSIRQSWSNFSAHLFSYSCLFSANSFCLFFVLQTSINFINIVRFYFSNFFNFPIILYFGIIDVPFLFIYPSFHIFIASSKWMIFIDFINEPRFLLYSFVRFVLFYYSVFYFFITILVALTAIERNKIELLVFNSVEK